MNATASAAAQVVIAVIPIVGIVAGATIAFFYLLWNHQQKIKLIEQGIAPRSEFDLEGFSLLAGLLATTIGAALTIFYLFLKPGSSLLLAGLIPLAIGVALLLFYRFRGAGSYSERQRE